MAEGENKVQPIPAGTQVLWEKTIRGDAWGHPAARSAYKQTLQGVVLDREAFLADKRQCDEVKKQLRDAPFLVLVVDEKASHYVIPPSKHVHLVVPDQLVY